MQIKIIEEKENPLLKRKEIVAKIDYEGGSTPKRVELELAISKMKNTGIEKVEIAKILSEHGLAQGKMWVRIWETPPEKKKGQKKIEKPPEKKEEESGLTHPVKYEKKYKPIIEEKPKEEKKEEAPKDQKKGDDEKKEEAPKDQKKGDDEKKEEAPKDQKKEEKKK